MTDNDIAKAIPFEKTIECYKEDIQGFFNRYKNESGAEDCIEVCLIRAGYRTVLKAEEEINRLKAENDTLKNVIKNSFLEKAGCNIDPLAEIKTEAYKEFAERLLLCYEDFDEINEVILLENLVKAIDDLLKEMAGEK